MAKEWLAVDETAKSLFARTLSRRVAPFTFTSLPLLNCVPLQAGHVLEIVGCSNSGKSEILLQAAISCILPKQSDGIPYGGAEGVVLLLDLDCRFDMLRFINALQHQIKNVQAWEPKPSTNAKSICEVPDDVFTSCLKRFVYTRCHSSFHLLAVLKTLHGKILRLIEAGQTPRLLLIDSINAFYWIDRSVSSAIAGGKALGRTVLSVQVVFEAVVQELSRILESHPMLLLASKSLIQSPLSTERRRGERLENCSLPDDNQVANKERKGRDAPRDFMPAVWQGFVTHRLLLQGPFNLGSETSHLGFPYFTAQWQAPLLDQIKMFFIEDRGIVLQV